MQINPNIIMQSLMNQMQMKLPKGFQQVRELMQNNSNPEPIIKQLMSNATPEQKQNLLKQCKNYGVPNKILSQIQNMK